MSEPGRYGIAYLMRHGVSKDGAIWLSRDINAALRAVEADALEGAAQEYGAEDLADVKVYCRHVAQRLRELKSPAAAPAAEKRSGGDDVPPVHKDSGGIGNDAFRGASSPEVPSEPVAPAPSEAEPPRSPDWRIGNHYGIHVYCGEVPIATFHTVADAKAAVRAYNASLATPAPAQRAEARDLFAARLATQLVYARARIAELEAVLREAREMVDVLGEGHAADLVTRIDAFLEQGGAGEGKT